jgi:ABC-type transporter MlaC component
MEQFSEILRKEGYAGLVRQLEKKIDQLEQDTKRT